MLGMYTEVDLREAESAIVQMLEGNDDVYSPRQVVEFLRDYGEEAVSIVLWDLIGREIDLSQEWKLKLCG